MMKKKVIYIQEDDYSCGPVCIQSVVSHYGGYVPLETILDDTNADTRGTNAYDLTRALRKYGFTSYGRRIELADIDPSELPVIAHVIKDGLEHFLVIYDITENEVLAMDPAYGEKRYSKEYFENIYDDRAIFLFKDGEIPHYKNKNSFLKLIKSEFGNFKLLITAIFVMCLITIILSLGTSFHFKLLPESAHPLQITIVFVLIRLGISVFSQIKNLLVEILMVKVDKEVISSFTKHIFHIPLRFSRRKKTGQIVKKIDDATFIKDLIVRITIVNFIDVSMLIATFIIMFAISKIMSLVYLLIAICTSLITIGTNKKYYKKSKESIHLYDDYMGSLVEYIGGLESIKNLNREDAATEMLSRRFENYASQRKSLSCFMNRSREIKSCILDVGLLFSNLVGYLHLSATFTFYDLVTMQTLFAVFTTSIEGLLETMYHLSKGKAIYRSVSEFLDIEEESQNGLKITEPIDTLKIEDLSYSHDGVHFNFEHFNLVINHGDKILLRGPSGVGKSTLVKCLCGMLENYTGTIAIDGVDLKSITKRSLRNSIIYVGQNETLFAGTIESNIVGDLYDEERFQKVASITSVNEIIKNKVCGQRATILENASNISGGERSRIILARALYECPSVLIIDETLSSVSEKMEEEIISRLKSLADLTVIYITHRNKKHLFDKIVEL